MRIQLSDHFTYRRLLRFVLPSILMMVCTSLYSIVDGVFISNYAGKTAFAALNNGLISALISFLRTLLFQTSAVFLLPLALGVDGVWLAAPIAEALACVLACSFFVAERKRYHYGGSEPDAASLRE